MNRLTSTFLLAALIGSLLGFLAEQATAQQYFNGYQCTDYCSGHEAGYNWAEQNGITDPSQCGGNSQSFIEGCEAYAEENGGNEDQMDNSDSDRPDDGDGSGDDQ